MTLQEILGQCGGLGVYEKREASDDYSEVVFFSKEKDAWDKILADLLGPAIKPTGAKPTKEDLSITDDFGGIYNDQTLFKKEQDDATILAMFWPWQDTVHTTLKLILLKK